MRKAEKTEFYTIRFITLYRDDIQEIADLLSESQQNDDGAEKALSVTADGFELDSIDELWELKKDEITELSMYGRQSRVSFSMDKAKARITFRAENTLSTGVMQQIKSLLSRSRSSRILFWLCTGIPFVCALFIIVRFFYMIIFYYSLPMEKAIKLKMPGLSDLSRFLILSQLSGFLFSLWKGNKIYLKHKMEVPGFWNRENRDKIIIGAICAVFGLIGGIVINSLFRK